VGKAIHVSQLYGSWEDVGQQATRIDVDLTNYVNKRCYFILVIDLRKFTSSRRNLLQKTKTTQPRLYILHGVVWKKNRLSAIRPLNGFVFICVIIISNAFYCGVYNKV
jgi:hypothetical protein